MVTRAYKARHGTDAVQQLVSSIEFSLASMLLYSKVSQATSVLSIITWHMCMHSCWLRYKKQHHNWGEDLIVCESVTWEVWCCNLPSLTCSSVKVCLSVYLIYTWHDDSEHQAANVQQTNPQQKTKTTKTLKELVGSVEFCRLLRPWEESERENAWAREGEET